MTFDSDINVLDIHVNGKWLAIDLDTCRRSPVARKLAFAVMHRLARTVWQ